LPGDVAQRVQRVAVPPCAAGAIGKDAEVGGTPPRLAPALGIGAREQCVQRPIAAAHVLVIGVAVPLSSGADVDGCVPGWQALRAATKARAAVAAPSVL
jgi:predicted PhzF superfamily epimerase YddE/YHI9